MYMTGASSGPMRADNDEISIAALLRSSAAGAAIKEAAAGSRTTLRMKAASGLDLAALKALQGDVIFLDMDAGNSDEMQALADFLAEESAIPVVVTSPHLDVARVRDLMRIGVLDVIPQPLSRDDVINTLNHVREQRAARRSAPTGGRRNPGSVVTFIKSGGGVGATSLAVQGACALARGKDAPRVCLIDLDVQFGISAILMDAVQQNSIEDLVRDPERLDGALLRGAMVTPYDRFALLPPPATLGPIALDPASIVAAIAVARQEYAVTFVDLPMIWTDWTHGVLEASSTIALVVQMTVPSLRQARRQIETLKREKLDKISLTVIANRVEGGFFSSKGVSPQDAAKALGRKIDVLIPEDPAMQTAADVGQPLSEIRGGKSLEKKLRLAMTKIVGRGRVMHGGA
jgi:pilus assembly protein CpaE